MAYSSHTRTLLAGIPPTFQPRCRVWSWGSSFCVHAVVVAVAASLLRDLPQAPTPAYRMEFLLTDPQNVPDTVAPREPHPTTENSSPTVPSRAPATSTSSVRMIEQRSRAEPSIVHRTMSQAATPAVTQHEMSASVTTSESTPVERPTPIQPTPITEPSVIQRTVTPVTPTARIEPLTPSSAPINHTQAVSTPQPIERQVETVSTAGESQPVTAATVVPSQVLERSPVAAPAPVMPAEVVKAVATTLLSRSTSIETNQAPGEPDSTTGPHDSASHSTSASAASQAESASSESSNQPSLASVNGSEASGPSSPPSPESQTSPASPSTTVVMNHPPITRTLPSRPDYGWLKDLLKRRIMSLQAYPRLARMQGWEGIVVVRATINNDGSLLDAVVTESSGFVSLDEDALKLMQKACPIRLQHDLGQSHIEVFIPVHYRLER